MSVIEFDHVSKSYRLGAARTSLREALPGLVRGLARRQQPDEQLFWALNDVSFNVDKGEVLGIIGHNGAGKSTSLKLLSKVTHPTSGHVRTHGRMAALIELGAGFHPDLSGRENVYLNGAILGLKKREIDAAFGNIVEFAGLEKFIDTPIKRYSSGMYVRLAFAVASHVSAELLLVDEVLSVGDMIFQEKCLAKMNELHTNGTTIVFVSHNLTAVQSFCSRVLLLSGGQIVANGNPAEVVAKYEALERNAHAAKMASASRRGGSSSQQEGNGSVSEAYGRKPLITKLEILDSSNKPCSDFLAADEIAVRIHYSIPDRIRLPAYMLRVRRKSDQVICFTHSMRDPSRMVLRGEGVIEAKIHQSLLLPGVYSLEANVHFRDYPVERIDSAPADFAILGGADEEGLGFYQPAVTWNLNAPTP